MVPNRSKNRIFQPTGRFLVGGVHQVGVDVQGDGGVGVAQLGLDVLDVLPILESETGVSVPEVMEPDPWQVCRFQGRKKITSIL